MYDYSMKLFEQRGHAATANHDLGSAPVFFDMEIMIRAEKPTRAQQAMNLLVSAIAVLEASITFCPEPFSIEPWEAGTTAYRIVTFLMNEHMSKAGTANGKLKAPYRQLINFGVGARYLSSQIAELERLGIIECHRGGQRVATTYSLAWLPSHDGTAPSDLWKAYRNPELAPLPQPKNRNLRAKGDAALPAKGDADGPNLPVKGDAAGRKRPRNLPAKGDALLRKDSYQGGREDSDGRAGSEHVSATPPRRPPSARARNGDTKLSASIAAAEGF